MKHCLNRFNLTLGLAGRVTMLLLVLNLAACSAGDQGELRTWMQQEKAKTQPTVQKIETPLPYTPVAYTGGGESHPFDSDKLKNALLKLSTSSTKNRLYEPDLSRKREVLEAFPLDTLRMVGFMINSKDATKPNIKNTDPVAQVMAGQTLHNVRVGQYLGTDFGKVIAISEKEIVLTERTQDSAGIWSERSTSVKLFVSAAKENK